MSTTTHNLFCPGTEGELIARAVARDEAAIRIIVRANNRRLYRIARSIVRDDSEAEDVVQSAYLRAFAALGDFRQQSSLATWLTRIVLNEALQHVRRRDDIPAPFDDATTSERLRGADIISFPLSASIAPDPERVMAQKQLCRLVEAAIDNLPDDFRTVLVARTLEGLSIEETAQLLSLRPETVRTRLHRARQLLKAELAGHIGTLLGDVFPFDGSRCDRMTNAVIVKLCVTRGNV